MTLIKNSYFLFFLLYYSSLLGGTKTLITDPVEKPDFDSLETVFQRIQTYQQIEITINFDSLHINRRKDIEHPARLVLKKAGQADLTLHTKIRPRGRFRRVKCEWPPIRLNFDKTELKALNLYDQYDKLKLVTHCKQSEADAQYLVKEYWTYKLYNEVTDSSFRAHLLEITYIDEADATNKIQSYAVILENADELAHRLNGEIKEGLGIPITTLVPTRYHEVLLFNYMIGNTDWKLSLQKNLKLVKHFNTNLYTVVPYDFDFAKIVNPPYFRYAKGIPNLDKHNRADLDFFTDSVSLEQAMKKFQSLKKSGFTCFNQCAILTKKHKKEMMDVLKSYFKRIHSLAKEY